jgi:hypothetical protein
MSEETQQFLTVAFGGAVLVLGLLAYNNNPDVATQPPETAGGRVMGVARAGLPFLLVGYTVLVAMRFKGKAYEMARNVVILVSGIALVHAILVNPIGADATTPGTKWEQVSHDVTTPLAAGALFSLPIIFY